MRAEALLKPLMPDMPNACVADARALSGFAAPHVQPRRSANHYTGNAVVFFTVRRARVDCTRTTPGNWVRISVWMRSKSAESA